jgi:predicted 3-demethylubiquinone-9 3-methyltransferase (glyoxalase superfamily)
MTSITPFLWFDNNVQEAVAFYKSVFPNAKVETVNDFMATFELEGQKFNAVNGGLKYRHTPANPQKIFTGDADRLPRNRVEQQSPSLAASTKAA